MKVFLMYKNQDVTQGRRLPPNEEELIQDLELNTLFKAMALQDDFLFNAARYAVLSSLTDRDAIIYRQGILKDCLKNPAIVRKIYSIAEEATAGIEKSYYNVFDSPAAILGSSIAMLQFFMSKFESIKKIVNDDSHKFKSEGFNNLFAMLDKEFDEEFIAEVRNHLSELKFNDGYLFSAELGLGNKAAGYMLCKTPDQKENLLKRITAKKTPVYSFNIDERSFLKTKALLAINEQGLNHVANALAQSVEYIAGFFNLLRTELAFYIGCLNLHEELTHLGAVVSFPKPAGLDRREYSFRGLYDISLALTVKKKVVANDLHADRKDLVIITGANQGGKSTFLRSVGLAQMMMQCGLFVAAEVFSANIYDGLFTHFRKEEDETMKSGKLDEELSRMSNIVDKMTLNSMLLFNESFAATNEREGSEIAKQIISALLEKGVKIFFVTHLYEFAHYFYDQEMENILFLQAERQDDRSRTFKLTAGEPERTSYGEDLYKKVFGQ